MTSFTSPRHPANVAVQTDLTAPPRFEPPPTTRPSLASPSDMDGVGEAAVAWPETTSVTTIEISISLTPSSGDEIQSSVLPASQVVESTSTIIVTASDQPTITTTPTTLSVLTLPSNSVYATTASSSPTWVSSTILPNTSNAPPSNMPPFSMTNAPTSMGPGSQSCRDEADCREEGQNKGPKAGIIAGSVVAAVALPMLVFAIYMCWKRKCSKRGRKMERSASWFDNPVNTSITKPYKDHTTVSDSDEAGSGHQLQDRFGEPGPAIFSQKPTNLPPRDTTTHPGRRIDTYTIGEPLERCQSTLSDPFKSPSTSQGSQGWGIGRHIGCPSGDGPAKSQIGLALTSYSRPSSLFQNTEPGSEVHPPKDRSSVITITGSNPGHNLGHKRVSTLSSASNVTDKRDPETIYVGKALTAQVKTMRRHSLTPRVINIVSNRSRDRDDGDRGSDRGNDDKDVGIDQKTTKPNHRRSTRAHSSSPIRALYTGSPAKLSNHFGIDTWGLSDSRKSSGRNEPTQGDENTLFAEPHRGRGGVRETTRSCPPTSYPKLGRTMSQVKKTLRDQKGNAFASSYQTEQS